MKRLINSLYARCLLAVLAMFSLHGCGNLQKERLVLAPESPVLLLEVKGATAKVAVYDPERFELVEYGWIRLEPGLTLTNFDWDAYIAAKKGNR